jgi:purine-binding chemotaxis protein CheW
MGIVHVHGRLLEAVDPRVRLGLDGDTPFARLVVVEADGQAAAVPVEAVREVVTVPPAGLLPPPVASAELDVVAAVDERLVLVLRPGALVSGA